MKDYLKSLFLLMGIILSYYVTFFILPGLKTSLFFSYFLRSLFWIFIAGMAFLFSLNNKEHRFEFSYPLVKVSFWTGFIYVVLIFFSGFIFQFGRSPYSFTTQGILTNLMFVLSMLLGFELARAYFVNVFSKRFFLSSLLFTALLFTLVEIAPGVLFAGRKPQEMVIFIASRPLVLFSQHILASLLVFLGGPLASICFRGVLLGFEWFSPVLPDLPWTFKSFFGVSYFVVAMLVVGALSKEKLPYEEKKEEGLKGVAGWIAVGIAGVLIIWFFSGVFALKPVLIAGRSMEPAIKMGDIAVGVETSADKLKTGDVIMFATERGKVVHRIIKVKKEDNKRLFITKGDANRAADSDPVREEQIFGKVVFVIPKVGWLSIGLKNLINLVI